MNRLIAGILLACLATVGAASDREDVEITFDKHKGKIYAVYTRELKTNPDMGRAPVKLVLDVKIATDGRVAGCRILSSNAPSPGFGDKVCERVLEFQFAPRPAVTSYTKKIDFFPAG